jgi:hypothetical protein
MSLDLNDLTADWECPAGEICARCVTGRDGMELLQLRVDMGVMQMFPDGRPDAKRYRGLPTVLDYVRHETRLGGEALTTEDWRELERELYQTNYRRLALASLAEQALGDDDPTDAQVHLKRALRDIDACLESIRFAAENNPQGASHASLGLRPTLIFNRGRLAAQLRIAQDRHEEAIEAAQRSVRELDELLAAQGLEAEQRAQDPGIIFLRDLGKRLRREYEIPLTLRERLEQAVLDEDFETAAELRDELRERKTGDPPE